MIEFGKTLQQAREAKGLTISQIAEQTHMLSTIVAALEREDFSRIVAPIYGRGFVKLYCEAVGIDPKPLVAEFMEIYNGNREVHLRERPSEAPTAEPVAAKPIVTPEPVAAEPTIAAEPEEPAIATPKVEPAATSTFEDTFGVKPETVSAPAPQPAFDPEPAIRTAADPLADQFASAPAENRFSRYGTPFQENPRGSFSLPPSFWRFGILGIAAIAVLVLIFFGIRAIYRATMTPPTEEPVSITLPTSSPEETKPASAAKPATKPAAKPVTKPATKPAAQKPAATPAATTKKTARQPEKVPSLYID